jgi:hypothetical protein
MKLPAHAVRTEQARRGFPGTQWRTEYERRKFRLCCAPSCLPVGRDPAYKAGLAGHVPVKQLEALRTSGRRQEP